MSYISNIPTIEFTPQGLVLPTEREILDGVLNDLDQAFGGNLNKNLETPQGQLASSLAAIIANKNNQIAWLVNNLDPVYSEGIMQDAIARIYFIERKGQINSTAEVIFNGLAGTVIPKGFEVRDTQSNIWKTVKEVSILIDGNVSVQVEAQGVFNAAAHTITEIQQSIVGLDRVDNPADAIIGTSIETRADFAQRIKDSVAINALGMPAAVYGKLANLSGVQDCYVVDNKKGAPVQIGSTNYTLAPHSIYAAVLGGDDSEIAQTLWKYSGNGCDYNGNTTITITDDRYPVPKPTYEIQFMRPNATPLYFRVKVKRSIVGNYATLVKDEIVRAFNHENKAKIGEEIYAISYVSGLVNILGAGYLLDVDVGLNQTSYADSVQLGIDQYPTISAENIRVELL